MKKQRVTGGGSLYRWLLVLLAGLTIGIPASDAQQQGIELGKVGAIEGTAQRVGRASSQPKLLRMGDSVRVSDNIRTESESKAWVKILDGSHVSLGEHSSHTFNEFSAGPDASKVNWVLLRGISRHIKPLGRPSERYRSRSSDQDTSGSDLVAKDPSFSYVVATDTAHVQVLPEGGNADFVVSVLSPAQTSICVIWGKVRVRNIRAVLGGKFNPQKLHEDRVLTSCQMVYVDANKEPSPVIAVGEDVLRQAIQATTIPRTLPTDVPQCSQPPPPPDQPEPPDEPEPDEPPLDMCPCPPGFSQDPDDGECKPCSPGAVYHPYPDCSCDCPCPEGQVPHPVSGECVDACPTQYPTRTEGVDDPSSLPRGGCPSCSCCDQDAPDCTLADPVTPCSKPAPCGGCDPADIVTPLPGSGYECVMCGQCCSKSATTPQGDSIACVLNAAGFPIPPNDPCASMGCMTCESCQAAGGYCVLVKTSAGNCLVCQKDIPQTPPYNQQGGNCGPCQKLVYTPDPTCLPEPDGEQCLTQDGQCGNCINGSCQRMPDCPPGQKRDTITCECLDKEHPPCPKCSKWDGHKCVRKRCPDSQVLNLDTCKCEDPPPCPRCFIWKHGKCVPQVRCRPGEYLDREECTCVPKPCPRCYKRVHGVCKLTVRCGPDERLDRESCKCVPKPCPRCFKRVHGVCKPTVRCRPGEFLDRRTCTCKQGEKPCPRCYKREDGVCVPIVRCRGHERLDPESCRCVAKPCPQCYKMVDGRCVPVVRCGPHERLNRHNCTCVPVVKPCPPCHKRVDGHCVPVVRCGPRQHLDLRTCTCRRDSDCTKTCPRGYRLDRHSCTCIRDDTRCTKKCPHGYRLDIQSCTCIRDQKPTPCTKQCPPGYRLDRHSCTCVRVQQPPDGCRSCRMMCPARAWWDQRGDDEDLLYDEEDLDAEDESSVSRHRRPPHHVRRPPRPPDHVQRPPRPPDHVRRPPRPPDHVRRPPKPPDHVRRPPKPPDHVRRPPKPPVQYMLGCSGGRCIRCPFRGAASYPEDLPEEERFLHRGQDLDEEKTVPKTENRSESPAPKEPESSLIPK